MNPKSEDKDQKSMEWFFELLNKHKREYMMISQQIASLRAKQAQMNKEMDEFIATMSKVSGITKERLQKDLLGVQFSLIGMSIGNAIEAIILSDGPQKQKALIDRMRAEGVKISTSSPYSVLKNAILRDKRKRFKVLEDGRVDVVKKAENKKPASRSVESGPINKKPRTYTKGTGV